MTPPPSPVLSPIKQHQLDRSIDRYLHSTTNDRRPFLPPFKGGSKAMRKESGVIPHPPPTHDPNSSRFSFSNKNYQTFINSNLLFGRWKGSNGIDRGLGWGRCSLSTWVLGPPPPRPALLPLWDAFGDRQPAFFMLI